MKKNYVPQPMDTSDIQLTEELNVLVEQMAKNVHEVWAQSRMVQGWTYGEERNDTLKQHPCLVPYEELPEVEKAYDRDTALGTLKLICKLGFKISRDQFTKLLFQVCQLMSYLIYNLDNICQTQKILQYIHSLQYTEDFLYSNGISMSSEIICRDESPT